jgi:hypothetical protein
MTDTREQIELRPAIVEGKLRLVDQHGRAIAGEIDLRVDAQGLNYARYTVTGFVMVDGKKCGPGRDGPPKPAR